MNEYSKELMHWGVKLGAERKGHKYFARVEGSKPGSYRYFYDVTEYQNWKNGAKKKVSEGVKLWKSGANDIKKVANKVGSDVKVLKNYHDYKQKLKKGPVHSTYEDNVKRQKELGNTYLYRAGDAFMKLPMPKIIEKAAEFVSKYGPKKYSTDKKEWIQIDSKTGRKTENSSVTYGIEWFKKKIPLYTEKTTTEIFTLHGQNNGGTSKKSSGKENSARVTELKARKQQAKKEYETIRNQWQSWLYRHGYKWDKSGNVFIDNIRILTAEGKPDLNGIRAKTESELASEKMLSELAVLSAKKDRAFNKYWDANGEYNQAVSELKKEDASPKSHSGGGSKW